MTAIQQVLFWLMVAANLGMTVLCLKWRKLMREAIELSRRQSDINEALLEVCRQAGIAVYIEETGKDDVRITAVGPHVLPFKAPEIRH